MGLPWHDLAHPARKFKAPIPTLWIDSRWVTKAGAVDDSILDGLGPFRSRCCRRRRRQCHPCRAPTPIPSVFALCLFRLGSVDPSRNVRTSQVRLLKMQR